MNVTKNIKATLMKVLTPLTHTYRNTRARARTHARVRAHTQTRTSARTRTSAHTHSHARTHANKRRRATHGPRTRVTRGTLRATCRAACLRATDDVQPFSTS